MFVDEVLRNWRRAVYAASLLAFSSVVSAQTTPTSASLDWPSYGNDLGGMHYVNTDQINLTNVATLQPAWIFHTGVYTGTSALEGQPLIVNGIVYVTSPHGHVFAIDGATGAQVWVYNPTLPPLSSLAFPAGQLNRGVGAGNGMIFVAEPDASLVALNATTGLVVWKTQTQDYTAKWTQTMAPLFVNNLVIVGGTGGEYKLRGNISAYDSATGKMVWRFNTVPGTGEFGNDSWAGNSWQTGGATVWTTPVADTQLGLLYIVCGNPAPDENGSNRAGANLFSDSVVALNLADGTYKWHFQEVHHDLWDYDANQPPHLFTANIAGQQIPALGHANKNGNYFLLDRRTGTPLFPVTEVPVPGGPAWQRAWPTQPMPSTPALIPQKVLVTPPGVNSGPLWTPPSETPTLIQPGYESGPEWTPSAFSPRTNYAYLQSGGYEPWMSHALPAEVNTFGSSTQPVTPGVENFGLFNAVDTTTGKIAWTLKFPQKVLSGVVVAGDVVYFGESNGNFDAFNASTGDMLWSYPATEPNTGGANASPAVYVVNGREYVLMMFGGNNQLRQKIQSTSATGDVIVAFALPTVGQGAAKVVNGTPTQVPLGNIPDAAMMAPLPAPAPNYRVIDVTAHDLSYDPKNIVVMTGEPVSIHLISDDIAGVGLALALPLGPLAFNGPLMPMTDGYLNFTAPVQAGVYDMFSPVQNQKFLGVTGSLRVAPACPANTTPCLSALGVVSSGSYLAGAVSPGELVTFFGQGLGPAGGQTVMMNATGPVSTSLGGTQVLFDGIPAPLVYVQTNQVNAIVPYELTGKTSTQVTVQVGSATTNAIPVTVTDASPAIFTLSGSGKGPATVLNADNTLNGAGTAAVKGSTIHIFLTGEGQLNPVPPDGARDFAAMPTGQVNVFIGGINAPVISTEIAPDFFAGVLEIDAQVPMNAISGMTQPIKVSVGTTFSPDGPTIAIQ